MWELIRYEKEGSTPETLILFTGPRTLTIGRYGCDILLHDLSVSRKHTTVEVTKSKTGDLHFLLINHSKFGTLVNDSMVKNDPQVLKDGDRFILGSQTQSEFKLLKKRFCIAVSSMDGAQKQRMRFITKAMHGHLKNVCDEDCSFLVMPFLVVTAKVICALLCATPIVSPEYMELLFSTCSKIPFKRPNPQDFLPPLKEDRLTTDDLSRFLPDTRRASLFAGKTFYVFSEKQFCTLSPIVRLGKGEVVLCETRDAFLKCEIMEANEIADQKSTRLQQVLRRDNVCVIHAQQLTGDSRIWQHEVYSALRSVRRRPILESEIGFAVVYTSTSGYCNPNAKCPQKLYEEADISQAHSVNPFHLESQRDDELSKENRPGTLKRQRDNSPVPDAADNLSSAKRHRLLTNIVPPSEVLPPAPGECLVPDSEPCPSPSLRSGPNHQLITVASETTGERLRPDSSSVAPSIQSRLSSESKPAESNEHTPPSVGAPTDYEDPLSVLNNMPSLVTSATLSTSTSAAAEITSHTPHPNTAEQSTESEPPEHSSKRLSHQEDASKLDFIRSTEDNLKQSCTSSEVVAEAPSSVSRFPANVTTSMSNPGWSSKHATISTPVEPCIDDSVPTVSPPIEYVDLITEVMQKPAKRFKRYDCPNYKLFKKLWPIHFGRHSSDSDNQTTISAKPTIPLVPFLPEIPHVSTDLVNKGGNEVASLKRERERLDRLFEQMCEMPRGHL